MAAAARKEEERNERVVRGLLKLPPNRSCINCGGLGPQYVCTSFWTFICISCSGVHREFTHRVKSVSMSKFTLQEIEALQKGGNQLARELFLKDFDDQQMRSPDSSNIDDLREFINDVYVERKYAGARFSERPPRDKQNEKAHEEHRRASSYHSFSQSPPYDYHYEERHNGKQSAVLTRKPGSDRGHDGKMSGFVYSPRSLREIMSEDRFANESFASRTSDCSGSIMSEMHKTAPHSPNLLDNGCFSPPVQPGQSNIRTSKGITQSQIHVSTVASIKSDKSSLDDVLFEPDNALGTQQTNNSIAPSFVAFSEVLNAAKEDLFNGLVAQQKPVTGLNQPIDLYANMPVTPSADRFPPAALSVDNTLWATFDTPPEEKQPGVTRLSHVAAIGKDKQTLSRDLFLFEPNDQQTWFQTSKDNSSVTNKSIVSSCKDKTPNANSFQPWDAFDATRGNTQRDSPGDLSLTSSNVREPKGPVDGNSSQFWYSFDDVGGIMAHNLCSVQSQTNESKNDDNVSITTSNPFTCSIPTKDSCNDDSQQFYMDKLALHAPFAAFPEPSALSVISSAERPSTDQTISNPFDFPCDAGAEAQDSFMDVSALQAALPNPNLPTSFIDGLPETWFSNSVSTYVSSRPNGGLPYLVEPVQNSLLRNLTLSTISTGNPFA